MPLFPLDLLRIPVFALSMCTSIGAFAAQTLAYVALPFLLLEALGRSHATTGLLITAWPIATVIIAPIAGRLIGRVSDGMLGAVGLEVLLVRRGSPRQDVWFGVASVLVLATAFAIWTTGQEGHPWCRPASLLQQHGLWHVLCAVAAYLLFRHYAAERAVPPARPPQAPPGPPVP